MEDIITFVVVTLAVYGVLAAFGCVLAQLRDHNLFNQHGTRPAYSVLFRAVCWPWYFVRVLTDPTNTDY